MIDRMRVHLTSEVYGFVIAILASCIGGYLIGGWRRLDDGKDPYGIKHQKNLDFILLLVMTVVGASAVMFLHQHASNTIDKQYERTLEIICEAYHREECP